MCSLIVLLYYHPLSIFVYILLLKAKWRGVKIKCYHIHITADCFTFLVGKLCLKNTNSHLFDQSTHRSVVTQTEGIFLSFEGSVASTDCYERMRVVAGILERSHTSHPHACSAADGLSHSNSLWNLPSLQPARSITLNAYVNTEPPLPSTAADRQ